MEGPGARAVAGRSRAPGARCLHADRDLVERNLGGAEARVTAAAGGREPHGDVPRPAELLVGGGPVARAGRDQREGAAHPRSCCWTRIADGCVLRKCIERRPRENPRPAWPWPHDPGGRGRPSPGSRQTDKPRTGVCRGPVLFRETACYERDCGRARWSVVFQVILSGAHTRRPALRSTLAGHGLWGRCATVCRPPKPKRDLPNVLCRHRVRDTLGMALCLRRAATTSRTAGDTRAVRRQGYTQAARRRG